MRIVQNWAFRHENIVFLHHSPYIKMSNIYVGCCPLDLKYEWYHSISTAVTSSFFFSGRRSLWQTLLMSVLLCIRVDPTCSRLWGIKCTSTSSTEKEPKHVSCILISVFLYERNIDLFSLFVHKEVPVCFDKPCCIQSGSLYSRDVMLEFGPIFEWNTSQVEGRTCNWVDKSKMAAWHFPGDENDIFW